VAQPLDDTTRRSGTPDTSIAGVVDLVKTYAKQETVEPIKNAGRFVAFGSAGALALGLGGALVLLGLLRLFQTEVDRTARGSLSWLAYVIVLAICIAGIAVAVSRIGKSGLDGTSDKREKD